jgi:hypothetical protein
MRPAAKGFGSIARDEITDSGALRLHIANCAPPLALRATSDHPWKRHQADLATATTASANGMPSATAAWEPFTCQP